MLISVVIPLYNKGGFIKKTVESVISQSYDNFEIIIVNDGSTDNSASVVEGIDDNRITLINQENQGEGVARNTGIRHANAEWVALLDADDTWHPQFLERCISLIKSFPEAILAGTNAVTETGKTFLNRQGENPLVVRDYCAESLNQNRIFIIPSTCIIKVEKVKSVGCFIEARSIGVDTDMWIRLTQTGLMVFDRDVLVNYNNYTPGNISKNPNLLDTRLPYEAWTYRTWNFSIPKARKITFRKYVRWRVSVYVRLARKKYGFGLALKIFLRNWRFLSKGAFYHLFLEKVR